MDKPKPNKLAQFYSGQIQPNGALSLRRSVQFWSGVDSVPISEIGNNNKSSSEDFSSFNKKYTKYIPYIPWPTPCEVAVEMQTMVKCEHLAAESRGWSAFDWAEHCLKQARGIPEDEVCEHYTLRQWQFVSGQN